MRKDTYTARCDKCRLLALPSSFTDASAAYETSNILCFLQDLLLYNMLSIFSFPIDNGQCKAWYRRNDG